MSPGQYGALVCSAVAVVSFAAGIVHTVRKERRAAKAGHPPIHVTDPDKAVSRYLTKDDEAVLRGYAGTTVPDAPITMPSGQVLSPAEAQVLASFFAPPATGRRLA